ncbi:hypothetical protein HYS31_08540 [Candidatus Woesearchaeota archaeon]|nr:hypothetical protein [Candidatus Woesearchaeota archaeon]
MKTVAVQKLEDLPFPEIGGKIPLDPNIANLVRALHAIGEISERSRSCEGHIHPLKTHYPWVSCIVDEIKMEKILAYYNAKSTITWILHCGNLRTSTMAFDTSELKELHGSAERLAGFIFDFYIEGQN